MKLSIILPVYNVENYINRCLESLYAQDIPIDDYEILIVDDKSPDNSLLLIHNWQTKFNNINVIKHEYNKGLGAARNTGLVTAKGDYIWFIDTDDFVYQNCFKKIINQLYENSLDVLTFNFYRQNHRGEYLSDINNPESSSPILTGPAFFDLYFNPASNSSCSKIYRREFLFKHEYRFTEGVYWEDADWVIKVMYHAEKIRYIPDYLYYYCYNNMSISRTNNWKKTADMIKMGYRKVSFSDKIKTDAPKTAKLVEEDGIWNASAIKKIILFSHTDRKKFYIEIKGEISEVLGSKVSNKLHKILFKYPVLINIIFLVVAPMVRILKNSKT